MPMTQKQAFHDFTQLEGIAFETGVAVRKLAFGELRILRDHPTDRNVPLLYFFGAKELEKRNAMLTLQTYGEEDYR